MEDECVSLKSLYERVRKERKKELRSLKKELELVKNTGNEYDIEQLTVEINILLDNIAYVEGKMKNVRRNFSPDIERRIELNTSDSNGYDAQIDSVIPDNIPIVFHGNDNIGLVENIMKSGGLFTRFERGLGFKYYNFQISACYKKSIRAALSYAEPGIDKNLPYGAIFVFTPKSTEEVRVLNSGNDYEIYGGVDSINFREEPERLVAIITTEENVERLEALADETGIDSKKVVTHEEFLDMCKEKYGEKDLKNKVYEK